MVKAIFNVLEKQSCKKYAKLKSNQVSCGGRVLIGFERAFTLVFLCTETTVGKPSLVALKIHQAWKTKVRRAHCSKPGWLH